MAMGISSKSYLPTGMGRHFVTSRGATAFAQTAEARDVSRQRQVMAYRPIVP